VNPLNPQATATIQQLGGILGPGDPDAARLTGLRMVYAMVQREAAMLSYLDLFRLFAVAIVLVSPLVMLMKRGGPPAKADMAAH